ncbi:MAG TPA: hypothetical protein DDW50_21310 [Firmicutes bacterium]|nr:hypothetical protein [Bacillota bacterium]
MIGNRVDLSICKMPGKQDPAALFSKIEGNAMILNIQPTEVQWKKRRIYFSIQNKIIFFFLLVSLVPICIIGSFSYFCAKADVTRKTAQYSIDMLTQTVANIQLKLAEFENISVRLFINNDFNEALANYIKSRDGSSAFRKKNIEDYFNEYMISNQDIFAFMFICDTDNSKSIIITKDYYDDFSSLTKHFTETSSYQNIMVAGGGIVWSNTIKLNRNHFLILGRHIKDAATGDPLGILAIVVDEDKIDQLANLTLYNKLNISLGNMEQYSFIINNDGEIISSPFKMDIGKNIAILMQNIEPLKPILKYTGDRDYGNEINQGSYITKVNNQSMLVTYKSIGSKIGIGGKSGWHLISVAPTSFLYEELRMVGFTTLLLGIVFGIVAVVISFYVASLVGADKRN